MKKTIVLFIILALTVPAMGCPAFAALVRAAHDTVNVGNKYCPVSGQAVSGKDFVIYQGKRYSLCCPACKGPFLTDPAKYIAQMEKQEAGSAASGSDAKIKMT